MDGVGEVLGTGIAFPLRVDSSGRIAFARAEDDVQQSIELILDTAPGERPMRPEFGCAVHEFVFERIDAETTGRVEEAVRAALDRWEPRITVEDVSFEEGGDGCLLIGIEYRVNSTAGVRNLVYPFYVIPEDDA